MTLAPVSGPDNTVLFDEPALPNAVDHPSATQRADLDALDLGQLAATLIPNDPNLDSITPSTLPATAGATQLTVRGNMFDAGAVVEADQVALPTVRVSDTELTATFDPTVAGTVVFTVRNGNDEESNSVDFVVTVAADPEPDVFGETSDPTNFTIAVIQAYINGLSNQGHAHPETQRVLNLERVGQNRVTLVEWLDAKMGTV